MKLFTAIGVVVTVLALRSDADVKPSIISGQNVKSLLPEIAKKLPTYISEGLKFVLNDINQKKAFAHGGANLTVGQSPFHTVQLIAPSSAIGNQISKSYDFQSYVLHLIQNANSLDASYIQEVIQVIDSVLLNSDFHDPTSDYIPGEDPTRCPYPKSDQSNCDTTYQYRTEDGSCNNLKNPLWGRAARPFDRLLDPDYSDGLDGPRRASDGSALPSARKVSLKVSQGKDKPDQAHSFLLTVFGQFLDHDITLSPLAALAVDHPGGEEEAVHVTCGTDGCNTTGTENKDCLPIEVESDDPVFGGKSCLMFVRSSTTPADGCPVGPRQQLNEITSFVDASNVYGSTKKKADELRDLSNPNRGRLYMEDHPLGHLKLLKYAVDRDCRDVDNYTQCFTAGDIRVNEHIGLTAVHTVFNRIHNLIEEKLHALNQHWSGEKLYQESRKIVIAAWQYMVYNEFLPLVLGPREMRKHKLILKKKGYYRSYKEKTNPEIGNAFGAAAYRFGHTTIPSTIKIINPVTDALEDELPLSKVFFRPAMIYKNFSSGASNIDGILKGMYNSSMQSVDRHLTTQVTEKLFSENPPNVAGIDLMALNIQRGRDHGIPGYTAWRKRCGLSVPKKFKKMTGINRANQKIFKKLYKTVDDVDLFAAGIAEKAVKGGLVGPTFACIIGEQFRKLRVGDRFWHERKENGFTKPQLQEIRKVLLSKMLCDVSDQVTKIQRYVMLQPGKSVRGYQSKYSNAVEACSGLPEVDYSKWLESP